MKTDSTDEVSLQAAPHPQRFEAVIGHMRDLQRQRPDDQLLASQVEIAAAILRGKRPGIEAKYDALLMKLTRMIGSLQDQKARIEDRIAGTVALIPQAKLKGRLSAVNGLLNDLRWVEARNQDFIRMADGKTLA